MQVIDRQYLSKYYNDTDFSSNLTDYNNNLAGSVMEEKKLITTINVLVETKYVSSQSNTLTVDTALNTFTLGYGNFIDDGFRVGDLIGVGGSGTSYTLAVFQARIISVTPNVIGWVYDSGTIPTSGVADTFTIQLKSNLESFILNYGIIENNDTTNYFSILDGVTVQGWYGSGIDFATNAWLNLTPLGNSINKSWINGSCRIKFVQRLGSNFEVQQFQVEHTFLIPYYVDGQLTNLQTLMPIPELLSSNSYKYVADYKFRVGLSNPNSERNIIDDTVLGSVGYFNESFNGFSNNFSISNVSYKDVFLNQKPRIEVGSLTLVTFDIDSIINSFSASTNVGCYVSFLPDLAEQQNSLDDLPTNFIYENVHFMDGVQPSNIVIQNISRSFLSPNKITIELLVNFNDSRLTNLDYYIIGVEVASDGGTNPSSDKTMLICALDTFDKSNDIPNLFDVESLEFELYNDVVPKYQVTDLKGWVEDTMNVRFNCWLDTSLNAYLNKIDYKLAAYNPTTNHSFELESLRIANNGTLVSGVQVYNIDNPRGFNFPSKGDYNIVKFVNDTTVGSKEYYNGELSIKMDWQSWSALPSADTVFYDAIKLNNGLNENASNYSLKNGYEIRLFLDADVQETTSGIDTAYRVSSPTLEVYNYDLDNNITPTWSGNIQTFSGATNLGGALLFTSPTTIKSVWTTTGSIGTVSDYLCFISLEPINSISKNAIKIYNTTLSIVGSNLVAEYTVNPSDLTLGTVYKISSRLRNVSITGIASPFARLTNQIFSGGTSGIFLFDFELKESDDVTPLSSGDPVQITLRNGVTVLESIEGTYGSALSSFTPVLGSPTPASSITNWVTGNVTDGGTIQFTKKQWSDANNLNYANGSMVGSNWQSSAIILNVEVKATDLSTGQTSSNGDRFMDFERVVDLIEGSVFWGFTNSGGAQDLAYSMHDNDGLADDYLAQSVYEKYKDGILVYNTLPTFVTTNFSWGTRDLAQYSRNDINGFMEQRLSFNNGMIAVNNWRTNGSNGLSAYIQYDRLITGLQKIETFAQVIESNVSSTVIERALRLSDSITPTPPANPVNVYINGSLNQIITTFNVTSVNSSESNWFNLDMVAVGQRNTVRTETTMTSSNYEVSNEYQLELNYVY